MSQRSLAPRIGVSHATISEWETAKAPIAAELLPQLGELLGVHASDFFEHEEPAADRPQRVAEPVLRYPRNAEDQIEDQAMLHSQLTPREQAMLAAFARWWREE